MKFVRRVCTIILSFEIKDSYIFVVAVGPQKLSINKGLNVTGFVKTVPNRTFSISRNTVLKYYNNCVSLVLHYSRARLAV